MNYLWRWDKCFTCTYVAVCLGKREKFKFFVGFNVLDSENKTSGIMYKRIESSSCQAS